MIKVFENKSEISTAAAEQFVQIAQTAISERGQFTVALTGGTSPEALYTMLAVTPYLEQVDWSKTYVFWGDERWVPLTDEKSNAKMANRTLLSKVPVSKDHIYYMWAEDKKPEKFAKEYEQFIRQTLSEDLSFDLILLGMGAEGHTASLFPYEPVLQEKVKLVDAYYLKSQNMYRITFTAPLINNAKNIIVMLYGEEKAAALHEVLEGEHNPNLYPAQLLQPAHGQIYWFIDKSAGKDLNTGA